MGLGFKDLSFNLEGDSFHIHSIITTAFPQLNGGGYMFLIHAGTDLVVIEPPSNGRTVKYLKDIVQRGQLFVRPIQLDISEQHQVEPNLVCHNRYCTIVPLTTIFFISFS